MYVGLIILEIVLMHSEDRAAVDADALRHDGATGMVAQNGTLELDNV